MIDLTKSPAQLKASILQDAMMGKLTQQLPEDGDAKDLLTQIKAEKDALIKAKKIKKQKALPEIEDDEIPFEIPDNWQWVRLRQVTEWYSGGKTPNKSETSNYEGNNLWVRSGDLNDDYLFTTNKKISTTSIESLNLKKAPINSIIMARVGATIAKLCILKEEATYNDQCFLCIPYKCDIRYIFFYLLLSRSNFINMSSGGAQPNLPISKVRNYLIPIPPLHEQKRIVQKLDSLLPKVDEFNHSVEQLHNLREELPSRLRRSFLQSAMMGQLTKQLTEDGDAGDLLEQIKAEKEALVKTKKIKAQKSLPEITADDIPFEIPDNWRWVRLGEIYSILQVPTVSKNQYKENGIPFYRIKDIVSLSKGIKPSIDIFISKEDYFKNIKNKGNVTSGDILITATGTLGTTFIVENDEPMYFQGSNNIIWLKNITHFNSKFINIILQSNEFSVQIKKMAKGSTLKHLSMGLLANLPIPLPPLSEQNRIVNKLDKLLDELKG